MPKIAITILYSFAWKEVADICVPIAKDYADKNDYIIEALEFPEWKSDSGYNKLDLIKDIFKYNEADVIWSIDCDTLITNHNIKVEQFIDEEHSLFICNDINGINAGSFIIRKTEWSEKFIDYCLGQKGKQGMYCEQNAFEAFIENHPSEAKQHIKLLPHPSINSYRYDLYPQFENITSEKDGNWHEGNLLLHLPAMGTNQRLEILKSTKIIK